MRTFKRQPRGLFINPSKAQCSIYESGIMIYKSLLLSKRYSLDYLEIDGNHRDVSNRYDFYAFNYHYSTMGWLNTKSVRSLPGMKITFVLEVIPNNPFILCPESVFDAYCVLDPTMRIADKRVYAFTRPLEIIGTKSMYKEPEIPTIGSFGFATSGKGFDLVVDAVNREFDRAIVRINIPPGTYTDGFSLRKTQYTDYLVELCQKVAKEGVQVVVTHDYMTKEGLIAWCAQNTLNCFLYNRSQPGLAATTDQAISSGRPLAVSANETFRHIHPYITPYPLQSLKESISSSLPQVLKMQRDWSPEKFAAKFEAVLDDYKLFSAISSANSARQKISLKKKHFYWIKKTAKRILPYECKMILKYLLKLYTKLKGAPIKDGVA
jgi:hypothetical protein